MEIVYIEDMQELSMIKYVDKIEIVNKKVNKCIDELCINFLSTMQGRIKSLQKKFGLKYNVPIYINENNILFKIMDNHKIYWINYLLVDKIYKSDKIMIIFKNSDKIVIDGNYRTIINNYRKVHNIYLNIKK